MRFHFNAHNLVVFGREGDLYHISDPVGDHTVTCPRADLQRARFVKGVFAPKGLIYYPTSVPQSVDFERAIQRAVRKTTFIMLKTPVPLIGVRAIRLLAGRIRRLRQLYSDEVRIRLFINFVVRMQEEIGTGGGGFRFIYASFLQESGKLLDNERMLEASELMTQAGDSWREFALNGARTIKKKTELNLDHLADLLVRCAGTEETAYRCLRDAV